MTAGPLRPESTRTQFWHRHIRWRHRILPRLGSERRSRSHPPGRSSAWKPASISSTPPTCIPNGLSEEILGKAIEGRRQDVLISTKTTFRLGNGPNDVGSSRHHLIQACEASLRRLGTDYIDIYHLHGFDALTPVEEVLSTLNHLVESGKVRYIACSNFSGWHLMKSLAVSERYGWSRYVGHQVYYSLVGREYEWELMPLALDQGVGALVWSPLGWGRLTGKIRRGQPFPAVSRLHETGDKGPPVRRRIFVQSRRRPRAGGQRNWKERAPGRAELAAAASHRFYGDHRRPQRRAVAPEPGGGRMVALAGADRGARPRQRTKPIYPYWHQWQFAERNPLPVTPAIKK